MGSDCTKTAVRRDDRTCALFVDDQELRRRIAPHIGYDRFRATVRGLEKDGFPAVHKLWGGRYWPAVRAWLDLANGVGGNTPVPGVVDGPETF